MAQTIARTLMNEIRSMEVEIESKKARLAQIQRECRHEYGKPEYTPDVTPGYFIPEERHGIHFQSAMNVPEKRTDKWTRRCPLCEKTQTTTEIEKHVTTTPKFPTFS